MLVLIRPPGVHYQYSSAFQHVIIALNDPDECVGVELITDGEIVAVVANAGESQA